jgi:hypothetical protein
VLLAFGTLVFLAYLVAILGVGFGSGLRRQDAIWYVLYAGVPILELLCLAAVARKTSHQSPFQIGQLVRALLIAVWCLNLVNFLLSFTGLIGIS